MPELSNPHDRFFKQVMARKEIASDFLRYYLPAEVSSLLDHAALQVMKDSYVDGGLREHFSDLLYKVPLLKGGDAYVYVLFEHKSQPEPLVALQLLRYMTRIWEDGLRRQEVMLPILPVVVYHGTQPWLVPANFQTLFHLPPPLAQFTPEYCYWLCDLSVFSDEEIRGHVMLRVALLTLKYVFDDNLRHHLPVMAALWRELSQQRTGIEYIETVLRYLVVASNKVEPQDLNAAVQAAFPEGG